MGTWAGLTFGSADGTGVASRLRLPAGVAADSNGIGSGKNMTWSDWNYFTRS